MKVRMKGGEFAHGPCTGRGGVKSASIGSVSWLMHDSVSAVPVLSSHHVAGGADIALGVGGGQLGTDPPVWPRTVPNSARTGTGREGEKDWSWHLLPRPHPRDFLPGLALPVFLPGPWRPFPPRS